MDTERVVYDIKTFCKAHSISRAHLHNLWADGKGPRRKQAGTKVLITKEAAAEWRGTLAQPHRE